MESCSTTQDDNDASELLQEELKQLKQELQEEKTRHDEDLKRLQKAEFERDSAKQYADSLREEVKELGKKLSEERTLRKKLEKSFQHLRAQAQKDETKTKTTAVETKARNSAAETKTRNNAVETKARNAAVVIDVEEEEKKKKQSALSANPVDLVSELKTAAEQAVAQSSFVYDENTGLYYDWSSGYYYDATTCLYYDHKTGTYYYYDGESQSYVFHSQVEMPEETQDEDVPKKNRKQRRKEQREMEERMRKERGDERIVISDDESEDGEIKGYNDEEYDSSISDADTDIAEDFPPCIRAIVLSSPKLKPGSLTIFTCLGGTIGREKGRNHLILISDVEISKDHAKIFYKKEAGQYFIQDLGSQNGTYINQNRLSEARKMSDPVLIMHEDTLRVGKTMILLHIHQGTDTCDSCEPGQVQAELAMMAEKSSQGPEDSAAAAAAAAAENGGSNSKLDAEARRRKELKKLKQLYYLEKTDYSSKLDVAQGGKYKDRADTRRCKVGSDAPIQLPDDAPSSVHRPIAKANKGRRLLEKMGWKDGEGLGREGTGRTVPVLAELHEQKKGLGTGVKRALDNPTGPSNSFHWDKARERFKAVCLSEEREASMQQGAQQSGQAQGQKIQDIEDIFAD